MCLFDFLGDAMVEEGLPASALEGGSHVEHASRSLESPAQPLRLIQSLTKWRQAPSMTPEAMG